MALVGAVISLFVIIPWLRPVPVGAGFDGGIALSLAVAWREQALRLFA